MPQSYYGGSSARDGLQRQLSAESFSEFVDRYINVPHLLKIKRDDFHALSKRERGLKKDGPHFTACTFREGTTKREDANAVQLTLIALDLDFPSEDDQALGYQDFASPFCEAPDTLAQQLYPYNFAAYETASSLPGSRCIRVVIDIEPSDPETHKSYVALIAKLLGIHMDKWKGVRESGVLSQPMFRPVQFLSEDTSPVICSRTNGQQMDEMDIPKDILEAVETAYAYQGDYEGGGSLAHLPLTDLAGVEAVVEPINCISPDCDYREWTMVASALRHQFRDEEEAQEAFELFDSWSAKGSKYQGQEETLAKWRSFKPEVKGKLPITLRSVFKKAIEVGWDHAPMLNEIKKSITEWIEDCEDEDVLMNEGARRVAALPFRNSIVEEALAVRLKARLDSLAGVKVDKRTVTKAIRSARREQVKEDESSDLPTWLRPWCFISTRNVFRHLISGLELSPAAFDNTFSIKLMAQVEKGEDDGPGGKPPVLPTHYALNLKNIPRVDGTAYDPFTKGEEPYFKFQGATYLNEYSTRDIPEEDPDNAPEAMRIFKTHLKVLIAERELRTQFLDFLAFLVQNPGVLIRWAPFIQSAEGAGKSILFDILRALVGPSNVKICGSKVMSGNYNDWGVNCQILIAEEMFTPGAGHRRMEFMNAFKDLITNDHVLVNQKYKDAQVCKNTSAKLCFSNHHDALQLDDSDRRYMVIFSPLQTKEQVVALTEGGHFNELSRLKDELAGALLSALMNRKVPKSFPVNGPAPDTPYRKEVIRESKNSLQAEIEEMIDNEEELLVTDEFILLTYLNENVLEARNNYKPSHYLAKLNYVRYDGGKTFRIGGYRSAIWIHRDNYDPDLGLAEDLLREIAS